MMRRCAQTGMFDIELAVRQRRHFFGMIVLTCGCSLQTRRTRRTKMERRARRTRTRTRTRRRGRARPHHRRDYHHHHHYHHCHHHHYYLRPGHHGGSGHCCLGQQWPGQAPGLATHGGDDDGDDDDYGRRGFVGIPAPPMLGDSGSGLARQRLRAWMAAVGGGD